MDFPHVFKVCKLFGAIINVDASQNLNHQPVSLVIPSKSREGVQSVFVLTPGFSCLDALDVFCELHYAKFHGHSLEIAESGTIPWLFWQPNPFKIAF